ncbi:MULTISPECIES: protein-disulfide reductase DsbD [unclassified Campylobacter]|uniref:protein-disulfide reductase DsbD n=1 Tax=unclassified Campylobacter TaxID=2593542 RepID=UPI003D351B1C
MLRLMTALLLTTCIAFSQVLNISEAFDIKHKTNTDGVEFSFKFGENIYIYKDTFNILLDGKNINNSLDMPPHEQSGEYNIIFKEFSLLVPKNLLQNDISTITLNYQGCAKNGICYRPQTKIYTISYKNGELKASEQVENTSNEVPELADDERIANELKNTNFILSLATFFGYGLLLALTPCIFPMIPILSSIIISKGGSQLGAWRGFVLSLVYVVAMSLAYALAGVAASFLGLGLGGMLQNGWVLGSFALVFIGLAFSMFGFYDLRLPAKFENFINKRSQGKSGLFGVFIMGFAAALVVSPCVAAPLAGALLYIAQSGNALYGGVMLFVMGLGMGIPLLVIGTSSGKILPKPGKWMDAIKAAFGFLMLAMAVWLLSRTLGSGFELAGYGVIGVFMAVFFGAFEPASSAKQRAKKAIFLLLFIYSAMLLVGAFSGAKDPLKPLANFNQNTNSKEIQNELNFRSITNLNELKQAIQTAQKPLMIDFYADWCASCKELESITFTDQAVVKRLKEFELIRIDVTKQSSENDAMLKEFSLIDPPALLFFKNGEQLSSKRIIGFISPEKFLEKISGI